MRKYLVCLAWLLLCSSAAVFAQTGIGAAGVVDAVTSSGERVRLLPDGRWEWGDQKKAAVQQEARKKEDDVRQTELKRERGAQGGGLFGLGRTLYEGDKDYNRGSLNPKTR